VLAEAQKVNILLVDDKPEGLLALEAILEGLDQNLVTANSGREALLQVLAREFAVILMDVHMPQMDGYETATLIRGRPATHHTPIIFLTASYKAEVHMIHGYSVGAVDYLFKPLDPEVLRSKVAVFVELHRKSVLIQQQSAELSQRETEARALAESRAALLVALEQKNRDLEVVNQELEAFSYSVSHDLRAPLRRMGGFSQALLEDYAERLDEGGRAYLRYVRESAQHMGELIDGLLALARVTRSELQSQKVDLSQLARDAAARLQKAESGSRKVEFVVEAGLTAAGDPRLVGILLENLLGNAWKFTGKRLHARIEFGQVPNGVKPAAFFVRDNGAGFDMTHADKLFAAFQRLHAPAEFAGHGIGLATAQRIVRRHGGEIWAEGQVGVGATFYFSLCEGART
jgi:signal transduction histidine kinase